MSTPMELTLGQKFEIERFNRAIDTTADLSQLRDIAKQLLQAWHTQKAATNWAIRQQIGSPFETSFEPPSRPELSPE